MKKFYISIVAIFISFLINPGVQAQTQELLISNYEDVLPPYGDYAPNNGIISIVDNPDPTASNESLKALKYEKPTGTYRLYGIALTDLNIPLKTIAAVEFQIYQGVAGTADDLTSLFVQFTADGGNVDPAWFNNLNLTPGWNTLKYNVNAANREENLKNLHIFPNMLSDAEHVYFFDNVKLHIHSDPIDVTGVTLNLTEATLSVSKTLQLVPTIEPDDATDKSVIWESSDETVATVVDGIVTGVALGTANITVTTVDGDFTAVCSVEVVEDSSVLLIANYEDVLPPFGDYTPNNGARSIVDNPDPTAPNESSKVLKYEKPTGTYRLYGIALTDLNIPLSTIAAVEFQIYQGVAGTADDLTSLNVLLTADGGNVTAAWFNNLSLTPGWNTLKYNVNTADRVENLKNLHIFPNMLSDAEHVYFFDNIKLHLVGVIEPVAVTGVKLNKNETTLYVTQTEALIATVEPDDADNKEVIWNSSDETIATVVNGLVTAIAPGNALITATTVDGGFEAQCSVTIEDFVSVTGITLSQTEMSLVIGQAKALYPTIEPANATNKAVTWSSDDETVATVQNGIVTGVSAGTTNITATTQDGGFSATCEVTVSYGIVLPESLNLIPSQNTILNVTFNLDGGGEEDLIWTSDDPSIVSVDTEGKITGHTEGTATITATTTPGGFEANTMVRVTPYITNWDDIMPQAVGAPYVWQLYGPGSSLATIPNPAPDDVYPDGRVSVFNKPAANWRTIGFLYQDGLEITDNLSSLEVLVYGPTVQQVFLQIVRKGKPNIDIWPAVTANEWNRVAIPVDGIIGDTITNFNVFVNPNQNVAETFYIGPVKFNAVALVAGVTLDVVKKELNVGESFFLTPTIQPANADNQDISWSTSDANVATVNTLGQVTGIGSGTAIITVTTDDGGYTATCEVTVLPVVVAVTGVTLDKTQLGLYVDESETLVATIDPADATNKNVIWTSSDEDVATVNENGVVTAVSSGTATITVTTEDGEFTAACLVSVLINSVENLSVLNLTVYPNPFTDGELTISLGSMVNGDARVMIYTITGTLAKSYKGTLDNGSMILSTQLSPGVYLLRLEADGHSVTRRLLVQ
jgi:uncharacterized protein YjdB